MGNPNGVVNLESRRRQSTLDKIAQVLQDANLLEPTPALVATPQPIAVSMEQGAQLLGVSLDSLEEQMWSGRLRTFRIGRRRLIRLESLNDFAHAQEEAEVRGPRSATARGERLAQ